MEVLTLFTKRSMALDFFKKHYCKKTRNYLTSLVYLVLTPEKELGWAAKNLQAGKLFFSPQRNQEIELENLENCQIISPESVFFYKNKMFWYKLNKATKDYSIVYVKVINSVTFAERLYPDMEFKFCLVEDKKNNIINCAWVAFKNEKIQKQIPIFQDEPEYKAKDVFFEPTALGDEFRFLDKKWYTCTEKGKCLLAELPII